MKKIYKIIFDLSCASLTAGIAICYAEMGQYNVIIGMAFFFLALFYFKFIEVSGSLLG